MDSMDLSETMLSVDVWHFAILSLLQSVQAQIEQCSNGNLAKEDVICG